MPAGASLTNPPSPRPQRLFFALWPDKEAARALHHVGRELQAACGGRLTRLATVHLTLVFLGEVAPEKIPRLERAAASVREEAFSINFNRYGWWKHNRIVWAMPEETPPPLRRLVQGLETALEQAGISCDKRPYVPHVTLLRKAERRPQGEGLPGAAWAAREFVLVRSVLDREGAAYEVIGRWSLGEEAESLSASS